MKIGILTFHFNYNFGARLQCMALQKVLQGMGHEVEVANYRPVPETPMPVWRGWGLTSGNVGASIQQRWQLLRRGGAVRERFHQFTKNHLSLSPFYNSAETVAEAASRYDAMVVGSDQVWNRSYFQDPAYFIDFPGYRGKRISYAACCGHLNMPQNGMEEVRGALKAFDAISVRNKVTYQWVHSLTGMEPQIVCDPTLLYDFAELTAPSSAPCADYILTYTLDEEIEGGNARAIEEIRREYGHLPVVAVSPILMQRKACPWADHIVYDAGPAEWVNLIAHAAFVYTDSFHGALFAMKHQRPFMAYYAKPIRAGRLLDIAKRYGVESAVVGSVQEAEEKKLIATKIHYDAVREKIAGHQQESMAFLKRATA